MTDAVQAYILATVPQAAGLYLALHAAHRPGDWMVITNMSALATTCQVHRGTVVEYLNALVRAGLAEVVLAIQGRATYVRLRLDLADVLAHADHDAYPVDTQTIVGGMASLRLAVRWLQSAASTSTASGQSDDSSANLPVNPANSGRGKERVKDQREGGKGAPPPPAGLSSKSLKLPHKTLPEAGQELVALTEDQERILARIEAAGVPRRLASGQSIDAILLRYVAGLNVDQTLDVIGGRKLTGSWDLLVARAIWEAKTDPKPAGAVKPSEALDPEVIELLAEIPGARWNMRHIGEIMGELLSHRFSLPMIRGLCRRVAEDRANWRDGRMGFLSDIRPYIKEKQDERAARVAAERRAREAEREARDARARAEREEQQKRDAPRQAEIAARERLIAAAAAKLVHDAREVAWLPEAFGRAVRQTSDLKERDMAEGYLAHVGARVLANGHVQLVVADSFTHKMLQAEHRAWLIVALTRAIADVLGLKSVNLDFVLARDLAQASLGDLRRAA